MERLWSILIGIAILYAAYALGMKRWDYDSPAKREELKTRIKERGLSTRFYFISAGRLLGLNILCGGLFVFYWSYKQWQAVYAGYKSTSGHMPKGGPFLRAVFTFITFYQFNAILNRTCQYMRKKPALSPVIWGTLLWAGLAAAFIPALPVFWRILGGVMFIFAPYALQRRVNALPKELPPTRLKAAELFWVPVSWLIWTGGYALLRMLIHP